MNFKLENLQTGAATGMDAFFESEPQIVTPLGQKQAAKKPLRVKVGSLAQLEGFQRTSADTLIHKSTEDLWGIKREGNDFYIERLFEDNGKPLKV